MINDLDTFDEQRMSASAVINALEPSENWDDDFEFQQGSSQANSPAKRKPNPATRLDHDEHVLSTRMSIASSHFTEDWDAEGSFGAPSSPSRRDRGNKSGASKSSIPPALAQWIEEDDEDNHEPTMSTPPRRLFADVTMTATNVPTTENWDDDFEDRNSPARGSLVSRMAAITTKPSWDEEFGLGPPPRRKQTARKRSSTKPVYSDSSSDGEEFGVIEEEDRTVTARSRRAVARPPVPTLPSPFHALPPAFPSPSTFPIARSPTSSVFSVPNADTRSYTSTTHLRPSSAHGHSLSHLPPSPPIHKSRERRRLRKKSRPAPVNGAVYEMNIINRGGNNYPYAHVYQSFSDGQLAEIRDEDEQQPRTPSPHPPAVAAQPMSIATTPPRPRAASPTAPVPPTPSSGGRAGALLSRIGSVTKKGWGVRRKRGSSVSITPNDPEPTTDGAPSRPSLHQPRPPDYQQQSSIPRPRSSRSSLHPTTSRPSSNGHSPHPLSPGDQPAPPTASNWFFRSASNTSGDSNGQSLAGYRDTCSTQSGSMSDLSVREVGGGSGSGGAPMTPSKLIKRKSLGFVQLRRGFGGHNNGQNEVVELAGEPGGSGTPSKRPVSMAIGVGEPGGGRTVRVGSQPRHASYGASSGVRERKRSAVLGEARGGGQHGRRVDKTTEPETDCDPEVEREKEVERGKEKERSGGSLASGMRAFMGNVRRLSIVGGRSGESSGSNTPGHGKSPNGKHKRTKSGTAMPIKTLVGSVAGRGSRSGTPTSQHGRPLTPSTSYPHLASAVGLSGMAKVETRRRSGSRSEFRSDSRAESRPGSRSGLVRAGSGRTTSPPQVVSSAMSSRQVSAASSASAGTSNSGSVSSVPMPVSILSSGRRRSGSASSTNTNRRLSTTLEDNQKTPRASKIQHYPLKTPDKPPPMPLLPPIELHPPSPPKVLDQNGEAARYQSLGMDGSTGASPLDSSASPPFSPISASSANNPLLGLSPSSSRSLSPIASLASPSASPKTIKEFANASHSPKTPFTGSSPGGGTTTGKLVVRPPMSPGQLQSASLGRSTAGSIVPGTAAAAGASGGSGSSSSVGDVGGGVTAVPRRNSLGDLKIPARISQAQSSLRRDLGMVREFAGHVEHMKSLQTTYDELVTEVQGLLERHAAGWYAQQQQQQLVQQVRAAQPNFFNNLVGTARSSAMKVRRRSYTNPEGKTASSEAQSSTTSVNQLHSQVSAGAAKAAYKDLATAFYTINSKYRISWECAELLVELGSGSGGGGGGGTTSPTTSPSRPGSAGLGIGQSLAASASTTAIHPLNGVKGKRSRERAITLAGDESRPSTPSGIMLPSPPRPSLELLHHATSQPHSPHTQGSQSPHPPLASPPSWRASTGRNDLSQRQLVLLKEMLNNPDPTAASSPPAYGGAIPEESPLSPSPHTPLSSPLAGHPSSSNLHVNRDWRWGNDPMSSTITLPSEEESLATGENQRRADGGAKKRRGRLNMSGFRDMLKALRKGGGVIDTSVVIGHTQAGSGGTYGASTASLSMESSADGHSVMQHHQHSRADRYGHARVGRSPNQQAQAQRRADSSRGPSGALGGGSTLDLSSDASHSPQTYSRAKLPPKSPRRPSLASIFRIGIGKNKSGSTVPASDGMPGSVPNSVASSRVPSGNSTSDEVAGGEDGGYEQGEEEEEEEDWDQIDSASDLDGHYGSGASPKPYGGLSPTGLEGSGTIRAVSTGRGKKLRKPNSPYLQQDPYAARSTSGFSVKRNASGSQLSLNLSSDSSSANVPAASPASAGAGGAVPKHMTALMTPRPIRLSNVQENQAESPVWPMRSLAHGHPSQLGSTSPSGISPSSRSVSGSSGKFHTVGPLAGANVSSKSGSVRSMPPQPISMPRPSPSRPHSEGQTAAPPTLALTPENIRPLLENAREVQTRLNNCIVEVQALLERAKGVPVPAVPLANASLSRVSVALGGQS